MFKLHIDTANSAFGETVSEGRDEVARILRDVADRMSAGRYVGVLRDVNGNTVGRVEWVSGAEHT